MEYKNEFESVFRQSLLRSPGRVATVEHGEQSSDDNQHLKPEQHRTPEGIGKGGEMREEGRGAVVKAKEKFFNLYKLEIILNMCMLLKLYDG